LGGVRNFVCPIRSLNRALFSKILEVARNTESHTHYCDDDDDDGVGGGDDNNVDKNKKIKPV
jgi:hypothetical protein